MGSRSHGETRRDMGPASKKAVPASTEDCPVVRPEDSTIEPKLDGKGHFVLHVEAGMNPHGVLEHFTHSERLAVNEVPIVVKDCGTKLVLACSFRTAEQMKRSFGTKRVEPLSEKVNEDVGASIRFRRLEAPKIPATARPGEYVLQLAPGYDVTTVISAFVKANDVGDGADQPLILRGGIEGSALLKCSTATASKILRSAGVMFLSPVFVATVGLPRPSAQ